MLEGETLRQRLETDGPLGFEQVMEIAIHLARALDHAHRQGVVHRDVKADNVVLSGGGSWIKLTDDIARKHYRNKPNVATPLIYRPAQGDD